VRTERTMLTDISVLHSRLGSPAVHCMHMIPHSHSLVRTNMRMNAAVLCAFEVGALVGSSNRTFLSAAFWSPELAALIKNMS
jgi:hypothetical protein